MANLFIILALLAFTLPTTVNCYLKGHRSADIPIESKERNPEKKLGANNPWKDICFPAEGTMATPNGRKRMDELQLGDKVLDRNSEWTSVIAFLHKAAGRYVFVEVRVGEETLVRLSPQHLIFRLSSPRGDVEDVPAHKIKIGDTVQLKNGTGRVSDVRSVMADGIYAPLTTSGSMVVDDVWASCFPGHYLNGLVKHAFVQNYVMAPLRGLVNVVNMLGYDKLSQFMFGSGDEETGILWYGRLLMSLSSMF